MRGTRLVFADINRMPKGRICEHDDGSQWAYMGVAAQTSLTFEIVFARMNYESIDPNEASLEKRIEPIHNMYKWCKYHDAGTDIAVAEAMELINRPTQDRCDLRAALSMPFWPEGDFQVLIHNQPRAPIGPTSGSTKYGV